MSNLGECDRLSLAIKIVMKRKHVRHVDLAAALNLSVPTMKRTLSRGPLSLERLMEICDLLEISFYELVEMAKDHAGEALSWMSEEQEEFLFKNPDATEFLIRMMNGASPEQIQKQVGLSTIQNQMYLVKLENHGLLFKVKQNLYKLNPTVLRGARPGGKLDQDFNRRCSEVVPQMIKEGLIDKSTTAIGFQLSEKARKDLKQQFRELLNRFSAIERQEAKTLSPSKLQSTAVIISVNEVSLYAEAYRHNLQIKKKPTSFKKV